MLPPIVTQLSPSIEQRPAITAVGGDVVVTAGAGAGKTRTLVARYLALLGAGLPLRSIVAITFTRKAAREMRNRLRETIRRYLEQPDLPPEERRLWAGHLTGLDAARMGTIHSLCADLLRAHPAEAGLDPRFTMLDEGLTRLLQQQVVVDSLIWAADQPRLTGLFEQVGEIELTNTLTVLLSHRLEAEPLFTKFPPEAALAHWQDTLATQQAQARAGLLTHPSWQSAVAVLQTTAADKENDKLELLRRQALATLAVDHASGYAGLGELKRITTSGSRKNWANDTLRVETVRQALSTVKNLWIEHAPLLTAAMTDLDRRAADLLPALHQLFSHASRRYRQLKQERNSLDFDDLEDKALALLRDCPPVRRRWQAEIQALLVDEFQDTNARQRDLLAWLNEPQGKLFIVGDAKQSIYRFRGADVAVFRQERQRIEAGGGQSVTMSTSYRAHRELIELVNGLFEPVLGSVADAARPWLEPFAPLRHVRETAGAGLTTPHLEILLAVGSKSEGALTQTARLLVNRLVELVEQPDNKLTYGDIAILCRSGNAFSAYENALEAAGVPFLTVAGRGFYNRPEIRDLLNALRAIADPSDDLALIGLLRSPALALSDEALYRLRRSDPATGQRPSLWAALRALPADLSELDTRQASRAATLIDRLHQQVGRVPAADLLKQFLDESGYLAALRHADQSRSGRNVRKLLDDANKIGLVSVTELVTYLTSLRDSGSYEGEARTIAAGAVQLMTVHAAKGLEFPLVVIGDTSYRGRIRTEVLFDPTWGVLLPLRESLDEATTNDNSNQLPVCYQLAQRLEQDQETAEAKRLLYVAVTRAQEKVLFSGVIKTKADGSPGKPGGWLAELATLDEETWAAQNIQAATSFEMKINGAAIHCFICPEDVLVTQATAEIEPAALPEVCLPPPLLAPAAMPPDEVSLRIGRVTPATDRPYPPARVVGDLTHRALASWRFPDETGRFDAWLAAQAWGYGLLDERQVTEAVAYTRRLLVRFQQHPLYMAMNGAAIRLAEVPYYLLVAGEERSGRLDALFQHDGRWTVVEFKTDAVHGEAERQQVLAQADYLSQVQRYRAVVEQFVGQTPAVILCWLNYQGQADAQMIPHAELTISNSGETPYR